MSETKTNKITTNSNSNLELVSDGGTVVITGSNLSTNADGRFTSGLDTTSDSETNLPSQPTAVNHLCRKDYVDRHTRIGATVCFGMLFEQDYSGQNRFGFSHVAGSSDVIPAIGTWTGWAEVNQGPPITTGSASTFTLFQEVSVISPDNWGAANNSAIFCLTRVS